MGTLSMEGSVFQADTLSRKELVQFAPFFEAEDTVVSPNNSIGAGEVVNLFSLPAELGAPMYRVAFLFHLIEGEIELHISGKEGSSSVPWEVTHTFSGTGTYILFDSNLVEAAVSGISESSLFDWAFSYRIEE